MSDARAPSHRFYFATVWPALIEAYISHGVFARSNAVGLCSYQVINLRDFALDSRGSVDDAPYGGGDGMVMRPEPIVNAIKSIGCNPTVIYPSPCGKLWQQNEAKAFGFVEPEGKDLFFICGRFAGIDQRVIDLFVDLEVSIGDFIVSGGELPSLLIADSIARHIPGSLGHNESASLDSFAEAYQGLLEHAQYTRPPEFMGRQVPKVLLSGDHQAISEWRKQSSLERTKELRPDLLLASDVMTHRPHKS